MKELLRTCSIPLVGALMVLLVPASAGATESPFPFPPELQPAVSFWIEAFTQVDKDKTILHDEDDLTIRYETLVTAGMQESDRRQLVRERRLHYVKVLENLALKTRERWNDEERRVAMLFPQGTGVGRFLEAAGKVHPQRGVREQFRQGLIRSGRWKATVEGILASYRIPAELAALPHIESSYDPGALSKAGAAGIWQFTNGTGRRYALRNDLYVDERRDAYVSTHAAARYLLDAYEQLGTWPLTITSYNHGVDGMLRARRDVGTTEIGRIIQSYDGPRFGFASKNFYAEFLAALEVIENRTRYFGELPIEPLEEVERIVIPSPARFSSLARVLGLPEEELRRLNPGLNAPVLEGRLAVPPGAVFNLPRDKAAGFAGALASLGPTDRRGRMEAREYRVRAGDTLTSIARRHGVSVAALLAANGLETRTRVTPGQRLTIPLASR